MRNPTTISGRVWIGQYFNHLKAFLMSGRTDRQAVVEAGRSLEYLLQREPGYARETRQIALQFAMGTWNAGWPEIVAHAVRVGLDADVMAPELRNEPAPAALLLIYLAESQLLAGDRLEGLATLEQASERLSNQPALDVLGEAARARSILLRAELEELERETDRARVAFSEARDAIRPLLADARRGQLLEQWTLQVFGPKDATISSQVDALGGLGLLQLEDTYVRALMGMLRTHSGPEEDLRSLVGETREAVGRHGLEKAIHPLLLLHVLARLQPDEATDFGGFLADAAATAQETLLAKGLTEGLSDELAAAVQKLAGKGAGGTLTRQSWDLTVQLGAAMARERRGELEPANAAYHATMMASMKKGSPAIPRTLILGTFAVFLVRHSRDTKYVGNMVEMFLATLEAARHADPAAFADLRIRALFDAALAEITRWEIAKPECLNTPEGRRRISVLLDLLRIREVPRMLLITDETLFGNQNPAVSAGIKKITNTLDRMTAGLAYTKGVATLISHTWGEGKRLFLVVTSNGLTLHETGAEFNGAIEALENAAEMAAFRAGSGIATEGNDVLAGPAKAAYTALPDGVRNALAEANVVLVAQDYHSGGADIPFELLHDGENYLLGTRVIARFTSLRHLARTLDTRAKRLPRARALVTVAPGAIPSKPLYTAVPESASIRERLGEAGFDTPEVLESRLSPEFFNQRLSYIDVLHIAAHGESRAGSEYVVLPQGRRLSVDDLMARRQRSFPFAYLNTCQLGRTRYLGGGQSRGLAYTFSELGSPAVIANTADVLDEVSTEVATSFYEEAANQPVGMALLQARQRLQDQGTHPALIGRVILFGNPWHTLGDPMEQDLRTGDRATELLDAFFSARGDVERLGIRYIAMALSRRGDSDIRFDTACALLGMEGDPSGGADPKRQLDDLADTILLADELSHPAAQAIMRLIRAEVAKQASDSRARDWLVEAIGYLDALRDVAGPWNTMLLSARAQLRRADLDERGLKIRRMGPHAEEPDDIMEAALDAMFASQQEIEDEQGLVRPRLRENTIDDILWNAVIAGHPNRFEDTIEASAYCRLLTRKLIDRGFLQPAAESVAHPMLTGLLWFLWGDQKTTYLDPETAEGQAGTIWAMLKEIVAGWSVQQEAAWADSVLQFSGRVAELLTSLEEEPWERRYREIQQRIPPMVEEAAQLLKSVADTAPDALAACAAFVTGTLAVKNIYTPLEGEDDLHEQLTNGLSSLNLGNEERFQKYLWEGFEPIRTREADELQRWRWERSAAKEAADSEERLYDVLQSMEQVGAETASEYAERGTIFAASSLFARAIEDFNAAIGLDSSFGKAFAGRAVALVNLGKEAEAAKDVDRAIELGMPPATREVVRNLSRQVQSDAPAALARLQLNDAAYNQRRERWDDAIAGYTEALRTDPQSTDALTGRGASRLQVGQYAEALEDFNAAIQHNPEHAQAYVGRAAALKYLDRVDEAELDVKQAIERGIDATQTRNAIDAIRPHSDVETPQDVAEAHCQEGEQYLSEHRFEEAIAAFDEAARADPSYVPAYTGRARTNLIAGHPADAVRDYGEALRLEPDLAGLYASRAVAHTQLGHDVEAQEDLEEAVKRGIDRKEVEQFVSNVRRRRINAGRAG
jgi:tetratricopeptide (TPR) repeat protein